MTKKLSIDNKTEIISSNLSSRELGKKHGVHHSVINDLNKESRDIMRAHWEAKSKRLGRPKKKSPEPLVIQKEEFEHEKIALKIKIEWLELLLEQSTEDRDYAHKILKSISKPIKDFDIVDLKKRHK